MEPESSTASPDGVLGDRVTMMGHGSIQGFMTQVTEHALGVTDFKRLLEEYEESMTLVREHLREVKKEEEESDLKRSVEANVMGLVLEMQTEEMVTDLQVKKDELKKKEEDFQEKVKSLEVKEKSFEVRKQELEERQKEIRLFDETVKWKATEVEKRKLRQEAEAREIEEKRKFLEVKEKSFEEEMRELAVMKQELEVRDMDLSLFDETVKEEFTKLEKRKLRQEAEAREIEVKRKLVEVKEKNSEEVMRELEAKQKELSLDDQTIKKKATELEKMKLKQEVVAREIELKSKSLEAKEKQLAEREKVLERKEKGVAKGSSTQAKSSRKRSRDDQFEPSLLPDPASASTSQAKSIKRSRDEFEPSLLPDPASASASTSKAKGREAYEVDCIDDADEDPEPYSCPDADFNNFNTTMSSFSVGQIWALYDPLDHMPRFYARIRRILEPQLKVEVRWLESKQARANEKPIPIACGQFSYGERTISNHSMFSHLMMHQTRTSKKDITINPRKGETWALFSDWSSDTDMKRPYKYDFVQVVSELDSVQGIGVAYLGRVEGFTSVYQLADKNLVLMMMIPSGEMLRFSHRVPSFELTGDEKKGVPAGSFELDPAAIPRDCLEALKVKQERV